MTTQPIRLSYNQNLQSLEDLLSRVTRPGNFYFQGLIELPMPKVEVDGVGILSFPIPPQQIKQLIQQGVRAPYGQGEETIMNTSVRKVWQLRPDQVRISGRSWSTHFDQILSLVKEGLGCLDVDVTAEFYKFLVYEEGDFFVSHRDTEKSSGMFGTLVIVLPSPHQGGELVIRHAGHEATVDLSSAENSELAFAAFYADCQHEARPVTSGSRVCLIYNLIQKSQATQREPAQKVDALASLQAPLYDTEIANAAEILQKALHGALKEENAPLKIVWLLEHQYTSAELSFTTLKNADAALAQVLSQACVRSDCAIHLAIVHILESGSAEPQYPTYSRGSRWGRRYYSDEEEECMNGDFEVIDVCSLDTYVDGWMSLNSSTENLGRIPIGEGELLPNGALDNALPDQQRLMEATGNEGVSYERSYHRAALLIWRYDRYAEVLLQGGLIGPISYLKQRMAQCTSPLATQQELQALAELILKHWENRSQNHYNIWNTNRREPDRSEMIQLLCDLESPTLLQRFIDPIVMKQYDGTENGALVVAVRHLDPILVNHLFTKLVHQKMDRYPEACVSLLGLMTDEGITTDGGIAQSIAQSIATAIIDSLKKIGKPSLTSDLYDHPYESRYGVRRDTKLVSEVFVVQLGEALARLKMDQLQDSAATEMISHEKTFDPASILVPALLRLYQDNRELHVNSHFNRLWQHAGRFLLARSEFPPEAPRDWDQKVLIPCNCEDCKELLAFANAPTMKTHRFRVRKDRRQHLHEMIDRGVLDMTHVTERQGSPQTLVCTKTRRSYELACERHRNDVKLMKSLVSLANHCKEMRKEVRGKELRAKELQAKELQERLVAAIGRRE